MYQRAVVESFIKLNPRLMVRNPVMFVVEVGSVLTTVLWIQALFGQGEAPTTFIGTIALWLWFTVLFANFSEALAEGRGKAQAESLRKARQDTPAKKISSKVEKFESSKVEHVIVSSTSLRKGDFFLLKQTTSSPRMARSKRELRQWMKVPLRANQLPSCVRRAVIVPLSQAARDSFRTGSSSA